jgi:hypothetical protein
MTFTELLSGAIVMADRYDVIVIGAGPGGYAGRDSMCPKRRKNRDY